MLRRSGVTAEGAEPEAGVGAAGGSSRSQTVPEPAFSPVTAAAGADLPPRNASWVETQFETKVETKAGVAARCQIEFKASLKWREQVRNEYDIESAWSKPVRNGCDIEFATGVVTAVVVVVVAEAGFGFCHAAGEGCRVTAEGDGRVTAEGEWGAGSQGSGSSQAEPEPEF